MLVKWLTTRLYETDDEVEITSLYDLYCFEEKASNKTCSLRIFINHLKKIFPNVKKYKKHKNYKLLTLYKGIGIKQQLISETCLFDEILNYAPQDFLLKTMVTDNNSEYSFILDSGYTSNGGEVYKTITFKDDNTWSLKVCGQLVDLESIQISNVFELTGKSISNTCTTARNVLLCNGVAVKHQKSVSKCQILENWSESNQPDVRTLRSNNCLRVVSYNSIVKKCKVCLNMTILEDEKKIQMTEEEIREQQQTDQIKHLLKHADKELVDLFMEQSKAVDCKKNSRRWSKSFIGTCMHLYDASPGAYNILVESNMLILPGPSTLFCYMRKLQQNPELFEELFAPMKSRQNSCDDAKPDDEKLDDAIIDDEILD